MTEEAKTKWQEGSQIVSPMKPIHYSNLGLLVEEDVEDPA
jgi:hypothetical protein